MIVYFSLFAIVWFIAVYLINSLLSSKLRRINLKSAILYGTTVAMLGVIAEVIIGNVYHLIFDKPLWNYTVYPVHMSYTSKFAPVLWAIYGFQMYLLSDFLSSQRVTSKFKLTVIFCIEAIVIEALVNLTFLGVFGRYVYYYFPSDLWHLTSFQTLPFYLAAGFVIPNTIEIFKRAPVIFSIISASFALFIVFLA